MNQINNSGLDPEQSKKLARYDKIITVEILARANIFANDPELNR